MKTLTLLRHAKSGWDDLALRDFDRPLNAKGKRAAMTVGRHWRQLGLSFDRVIASPAVRVVETLEQIGQGYGDDLAPAWDRRVYLASAMALLDIVRQQPDAADSIVLAGHNPGLEDLILLLVPDADGAALRDAVEEKFPTASTARLEFDVDRWAEAAANGARLALFVRPRDLDPALGPDAA